MKKYFWVLSLIFAFLILAGPSEASLADAAKTTAEGVVEFPVALVKLVGGAIWTIAEVIVLPFRAIFG